MIISSCGCGRSYDLAAFRALPGRLDGGPALYQDSGLPGVDLELRCCPCRSHHAIHVTADERRDWIPDETIEEMDKVADDVRKKGV